MGSFWILAATYMFVLPRTGPFDAENALVWTRFIGGKQYGFVQINKRGHSAEALRLERELPLSMKEAAMVQKWYHTKSSPSFRRTVPPRLIWYNRENGSTKTVAAIIVANRGYRLFMPVEGFLLAIGLIIMVGPTLLVGMRYATVNWGDEGRSSGLGLYAFGVHWPTFLHFLPTTLLSASIYGAVWLPCLFSLERWSYRGTSTSSTSHDIQAG